MLDGLYLSNGDKIFGYGFGFALQDDKPRPIGV
jgi:hypothetical protein